MSRFVASSLRRFAFAARAVPLCSIAALAACSADLTRPSSVDDGGITLYQGPKSDLLDSTQIVDSARTFMVAAGCSWVQGRAPAGAVWIPTRSARGERFNCAGLTHDSTHSLIRNYMGRLEPVNEFETPGGMSLLTYVL